MKTAARSSPAQHFHGLRLALAGALLLIGGACGSTMVGGPDGGAGGRGGATATGGSSGTGGASATGGSSGTGGGAGTVCGGITGAQCDALSWCDFTPDTCGSGDQQGVCRARDATGFDCSAVVCGCNGKTYMSACAAHQGGFDVMDSLSCIPGNGGASAPCAKDADCAAGYKCCGGGAAGSPIACLQVPANGSCPVVP
ncbi:MAG TPA: hypothetical protein VHO06_20885 [Polyangia bacterium]|nr:hypothetical protein [Polyangia bacterium]